MTNGDQAAALFAAAKVWHPKWRPRFISAVLERATAGDDLDDAVRDVAGAIAVSCLETAVDTLLEARREAARAGRHLRVVAAEDMSPPIAPEHEPAAS